MKNTMKKYSLGALFALLSVFAVQCGVNLYSTSDDAALGKQVDGEIRKNPKEYPILTNSPVKQYVQGIVNELIQSPAVEYRGTFPYTVEIIRDDKTVNAFCTPGGYIYVYTGLIKLLDDEASLAGVISHEIAHAERRHSTKRITKAYGVSILTNIALGNSSSQSAQVAANLFSGLALLKNSRDDESEADDYSFRYMKTSKWYPGALINFFDKVKKPSTGGAGIERLLSTHPLPQDRIEEMQKRIQSAHLPTATEENLFGTRYRQMKSQLP